MHNDFLEATLIEFTVWENNSEKTIAKFDKFEDLPTDLQNDLNRELSEIVFEGQAFKIIEINRNLRAHGKGMHVKVRLSHKFFRDKGKT